MTLEQEVTRAADTLEQLFERAKTERDGADGERKSYLRRLTKDIDNALSHLERAEDLMEERK